VQNLQKNRFPLDILLRLVQTKQKFCYSVIGCTEKIEKIQFFHNALANCIFTYYLVWSERGFSVLRLCDLGSDYLLFSPIKEKRLKIPPEKSFHALQGKGNQSTTFLLSTKSTFGVDSAIIVSCPYRSV